MSLGWWHVRTQQLGSLLTATPQGCVLSPVLFTLFTHDSTPVHPSNTIIKFVDNTMVFGLIADNEETANRLEVAHLVK